MENDIIDLAISGMNPNDFSNVPFKEIMETLLVTKRDVINAMDMCEEKGLIEFSGNTKIRARLTLVGNKILNNGGWLSNLESKKLKRESKYSRELLEIENLKLQKEALLYQSSIRSKDEEIKHLTRDNLRLNIWEIRVRCFIGSLTFLFGYIFKYIIDK